MQYYFFKCQNKGMCCKFIFMWPERLRFYLILRFWKPPPFTLCNSLIQFGRNQCVFILINFLSLTVCFSHFVSVDSHGGRFRLTRRSLHCWHILIFHNKYNFLSFCLLHWFNSLIVLSDLNISIILLVLYLLSKVWALRLLKNIFMHLSEWTSKKTLILSFPGS